MDHHTASESFMKHLENEVRDHLYEFRYRKFRYCSEQMLGIYKMDITIARFG